MVFPERLFYAQAKHLCDMAGGQLPMLGQGSEAEATYRRLASLTVQQAEEEVRIMYPSAGRQNFERMAVSGQSSPMCLS